MTSTKKVKSEKGVVVAEKRRHYDAEFKAEAVRLTDTGRTVRSVAEGLGISEQLLHSWRSSRRASLGTAGREQLAELEALRKQLRQTEMERDTLKKALAVFSRLNPS